MSDPGLARRLLKQGERIAMYRPTASAAAARNFMNITIKAGTNALAIAGEALIGALVKMGIYEQAMRENRRRTRAFKRHTKHTTYFAAGLNGQRAVARRRRQIARGQLRAANGLVTS